MVEQPYARLLAKYYKDKLEVYGVVNSSNDDGTINTSISDVAKYKNIPCKVSFKTNDKSKEDTTNAKSTIIKVFCAAALQIKKGDKLVASVMSDNNTVLATYTGLAGLPNTYATHQEIVLEQVGDA